MNKNNIEKIFKRFIKKRIGYSLSLLILFLITGGISLSTETITNLELEKEKIKKEISENEKIIKKYDIELVDLIKKGDFYSKPLFNSTQIFFSYQNLSTGKMKDNTDKEFAETIDAVNKHYGENILNSGKDLGKDKVIAGNGVVVDTTTFKEEIEIGANIKPVEPQFSPINSNISVNVSAPVINLGALPKSLTPAIPVISATTAPVINIPLLSSGINISIVPTEAIDKIDITAPAITIPKVPTEKNVVVNPPATPNGFEPTIIAIPVPPTVPVLNIPAVTIPNISTASSGNGDGSWYWNLSGSNGTISQVIMTSGKWDISVAGNSYTDGFSSEITDYSAHFAAPYGGTPIVNQTYSGFSNSGQMGMYRIVGSPYTLFGENTEINIDASARSKSGSVRQFIHFDPHGDKSMDSIDEIIDATDAERQEVKDIQAKYKTSYLAPKHMMLSMKGIINVTGNTINVVGLQGHYGPPYANPYIIHSGKINITGNNNVVFAYTPEHQNESRDSIISNYDSGEIIINGDENFVMVYDKQTITQSHSFKNDGKIEIENGNKNVGVYIKRSARGGTLDLIKPIIITNGNENIGIVHKNETYNQLNPQSVIKVDIKNGNKNIGLLEEMTQKYTSHEFNISGGTDGMAVISTNGVLSIGSGNISITGGNKNIGLITIGGNIISDGNIFMINGSENIAALAKDGNSISVTGNVSIGSSSPVTNSIPFYVTDTNSKIALSDDKLSINLSGDSIGVYSSDNGSFTANRTSLIHSGIGFGNGILEPIAPVNIYVEGTTISEVDKGIGLFANAGGKINTKNTYVKVKNGSVGIASMGTNSKIDITNGIVDYEGNGYAVYSDGNGHIDLTDGEIILRGKATAIELDLSKPNPITLTGAKIVWGDVDASTGLLDPKSVREKITDRTKAIMLVHYAGMVCDMDEFNKISDEYNIPIIEDAAHSLGSKYAGKIIGSNSRFTCYSFQAIKQMTTVDGGAIAFKNEEDVTPARKLRWFGLDKSVSRLENDITRAGYKYGMNNVIATIGNIQLRHTPEIIGRYIANGQYYDSALKGLDGIEMVPYYNNTEPSYWLYTMKVNDRDSFCKMMEANGISATPLHHRSDTHSVFAESRCELPNMEQWYSKFVHIPCGWWVNDEIRERIVELVKAGW